MSVSILCVHGIGYSDLDPDLEGSWSKTICDGLVAWNPKLQDAITYNFLKFDSQLPYDSHFAAIFDCCHSGGMTREGARKARGITPPDDIRHRALRWNAELQMWEDRPYAVPNPWLAQKGDARYLVNSDASCRIGTRIRRCRIWWGRSAC